MLIVGLAVLAIAWDPRPDRPTDEAMLVVVAESIAGAEVLQTRVMTMPTALEGSRGLCGIARIDGVAQPFVVYTLWRPADAVDGDRWATAVRAPRSAEASVQNNLERKAALTACPDLVPPAGTDWPAV